MLSLNNKQIILGITGGIAAYKSAELCRLLVKAGATVRVVMTAAATEFITPLTLQALSGNRVSTQLLDEAAEASMGHIELARWADLVLIAPASADFMARFNHGQGDDLLATLCLATSAPIAIAPAMNQAMWSNSNTQENLTQLIQKKIAIFGPESGDQACGDIGIGRMMEAKDIALQAAKIFQQGALAGLKVTITAGPTREAIDPVRYISNHSSGKMGYALAQAAMEAGATVTLISGPVSIEKPERISVLHVESAEQMLTACLDSPSDIFISVAAVADYRPETVVKQKIKKSEQEMTLTLVKNPDILDTISKQENRPFCVGFAAETENLEDNAKAKLKAKNLDLIFANHATNTFNNDESTATAYWNEGEQVLPSAHKTLLARNMIQLISKRISS